MGHAPHAQTLAIELSVHLFEKQIGRAHPDREIGEPLTDILESGERIGSVAVVPGIQDSPCKRALRIPEIILSHLRRC